MTSGPGTDASTLSLGGTAAHTTVLGPGVRAVVWVHGCPLRCDGCVAPQDIPFAGGDRRPVAEVAAWLDALPVDVTGLTLSGGEPMAQAPALCTLVERIRRSRDWSVMSFTGYTIEHLRRHGTAAQRRLLDHLDVLVDGPYLRNRHADLRWRGSANQRLHFLTGRHAPPEEDRSAGIELEVGDGHVRWIGVPPVPDFRSGFESALGAHGIRIIGEGNDVR